MNVLTRLLAMYGPLLFLAVLAAVSFWLSPPPSKQTPPLYSVALQQANYSRLQDGGVLHIGAARVEQKIAGHATLSRPHVRQELDNGMIQLEGDSGEANADTARLQINQVRGTIRNNGQILTLRADTVLYDAVAKTLSGDNPRFFAAAGELRGEHFLWHPKNGLKIKGNVQSAYER